MDLDTLRGYAHSERPLLIEISKLSKRPRGVDGASVRRPSFDSV